MFGLQRVNFKKNYFIKIIKNVWIKSKIQREKDNNINIFYFVDNFSISFKIFIRFNL
jgi:hypothetical protein